MTNDVLDVMATPKSPIAKEALLRMYLKELTGHTVFQSGQAMERRYCGDDAKQIKATLELLGCKYDYGEKRRQKNAMPIALTWKDESVCNLTSSGCIVVMQLY